MFTTTPHITRKYLPEPIAIAVIVRLVVSQVSAIHRHTLSTDQTPNVSPQHFRVPEGRSPDFGRLLEQICVCPGTNAAHKQRHI